MPPRSLFEPVIEGGIANPNWFEGRLLTAEAMRAKDKAERTRQRLLGRAIGAGVFEGLFVSRADAVNDVFKTLNISKGAALNGEGEVLLLSRDISVDVVPAPASVELAPSVFEPCPTSGVATIPNGFGLYVLLMAPASAYGDRAPKSGLGTEGIVTGCGEAFAVDGVQFRTEKLEPSTISGLSNEDRDALATLLADTDDATSRSMLRNLAAHHCFGTAELARFPADPFARSAGASDFLEHGAIDDLKRLGRITPCDVPLGLFLWGDSGVAFVDVWAVRRAPIEGITSRTWPLVASTRHDRDGRARFLQFQAHVQELTPATGDLTPVRARTHFRFLPAAGLIPVPEERDQTDAAATRFFTGMTYRGPAFINGARLEGLLLESFGHPSLDTQGREVVWLYRVRENRMAVDFRGDRRAPPSYLVFASGHLPYRADARFDLAYADYSNYALRR
jgi:hypothetical protein